MCWKVPSFCRTDKQMCYKQSADDSRDKNDDGFFSVTRELLPLWVVGFFNFAPCSSKKSERFVRWSRLVVLLSPAPPGFSSNRQDRTRSRAAISTDLSHPFSREASLVVSFGAVPFPSIRSKHAFSAPHLTHPGPSFFAYLQWQERQFGTRESPAFVEG